MDDDDWDIPAETDFCIRTKMVNKWVGEDEDEYVKDNWEDDDDEDFDKEKREEKLLSPTPSTPTFNVMNIENVVEPPQDIENETQISAPYAEHEEVVVAIEEEPEKVDLNLSEPTPPSEADFKLFASTITDKVTQYKESPHYEQLIEDLVQSMCAEMAVADMKKVKQCVDHMHTEKVRQEKHKKRITGKGKTRTSIRAEPTDIDDIASYHSDYIAADFDDFM